jgi:L-lactate dehydrogenase
MKTALSVQVVRRSRRRGATLKVLREKVEKDVRNASINANITIIEGHGTSQYGNGIVSARIAEMILRAERTTIPIGSHQPEFGVTLSLRSVVGRGGATAILPPQLSDEGQRAFQKAQAISMRRWSGLR